MAKKIVYDAITGTTEEIEVSDNEMYENITLEELKLRRLKELTTNYSAIVVRDFISYANGQPVLYGYDKGAQMIYSKWANILALNPERTTVTFDSADHQLITMTRAQFLAFVENMEQNEIDMYTTFKTKQYYITIATTIEEVMAIVT